MYNVNKPARGNCIYALTHPIYRGVEMTKKTNFPFYMEIKVIRAYKIFIGGNNNNNSYTRFFWGRKCFMHK